jgi:nucleoside-diphosphate kinase
MKQQTAIIIKPDAMKRQLAGEIYAILNHYGDTKVFKCHHMTLEEAKKFYSVHKSKPFYDRLCKYMTTYTSIFIVLEGKGVVKYIRSLIENYIRPKYGVSITENSIHGSDSVKSAIKEIRFIKRLK